MEIDVNSVLTATEVVLDRMEDGLIVNTASLAGILKGFNRESVSYYVAKHGVVSMTRSLGQAGRLPSRVEHRAICPAFADTAILTGLGVDRSVLERKEGISDPEWVGDCFLRLVQDGSNGEVMVVRKDTPPFSYPDLSLPLVGLLSGGARLAGRVGVEHFTGRHQAALLGLLLSAVLSLVTATLAAIISGLPDQSRAGLRLEKEELVAARRELQLVQAELATLQAGVELEEGKGR